MRKLRSSIVFKSISGIVILLLVFTVIVSVIGYLEFTDALMEQYAEGAFYTADTAALNVNADHLQSYLEGGDQEEYEKIRNEFERLCEAQEATFIYVICPDQTDYNHITFVISAMNNRYSYELFERGYVRETTNDEYRNIYRLLCEKESDYAYVVRDRGYIETGAHITALISLVGSDQEVKGILCVQRQMDILTDLRQAYLKKVAIAMILIALLVIMGQTVYIHRVLLDPLQRIIREAARFSTENVKSQKKLTDHIRNRDEIGELARSIDDMEDQITGYISDIARIAAKEEKTRTELSLAARIQASMLPDVFPPFPERKEFELFASMDPAKEVGGDFYDFFLIDSDHLYLAIADVSGKGIPGALFMTISMLALSQIIREGKSPAEVLEAANNAICLNNREEMFVTVWLGILEISTGKLTAANAGHEYPALRKPDGRFELFKDPHGFVVGGMEDMKYKEYELQLLPGSQLFLYTDGVPEATDSSERQFGTQRMLTALNGHCGEHPEEIIGGVYAAVDSFVGQAEQFDDMTMLCIQYNGCGDSAQSLINDTDNIAGYDCGAGMDGSTRSTGGTGEEEKSVNEMTLQATLDNLPEVTAFIDSQLEELDCPMKAQFQIDVAIDELFTNIATYAYGDSTGNVTVRLDTQEDPRAVLITFIDNGVPYNPLEQEEPDITLAAEDRPIGGLGIFVVKKTMDDMSYDYKDGQNILRIKKKI